MDSVRIESNRKVPQTIRLSLGVLDMYAYTSEKVRSNMRSSRRALSTRRKTKTKDVSVPANDDDLKSDWLKRDVNEVENVIKLPLMARIYTTISSRHGLSSVLFLVFPCSCSTTMLLN